MVDNISNIKDASQKSFRGQAKSVFLICFPTLRTPPEQDFWKSVCEHATQRGYEPVILAYLPSVQKRETLEDALPGIATYYVCASPFPYAASNLSLRESESVDEEWKDIILFSAHKNVVRASGKEELRAEALVGSKMIAAAISQFLQRIQPALIAINNDTYHMTLKVEQAAIDRGIPFFFTERSPMVTNWVEEKGFYADAEAWRMPRDWQDDTSLEPIGLAEMDQLSAQPAMHRSWGGELPFAPENGADIARGQGQPVFLIAMDAVLNTGWTPAGHPKAERNYPQFSSPEEAVKTISALANEMGAKVYLKPHPNDAHFNNLTEIDGVEIYRGSVEDALATTDVVFCFLTKVAFSALAQRKKVVVMGPNIAALCKAAFHCDDLSELPTIVRDCLAHRWSDRDEQSCQRFFGWLKRDYFLDNDILNPAGEAFLERYLPPLDAARQQSFARPEMNIPGILGLGENDLSRSIPHRDGMILGPFTRQDGFGIDEVDIVRRLYLDNKLRSKYAPPTMIDVGACKGAAFAPFLKLGWKVHAFEPNPPMFDYLSNKQFGGRLVLNQLAVSEQSGEELPFYTSEESIGISSLSPFRASHEATAIVRTKRLDEYLQETDVSHLDFLKIDTEGFDLHVLRSHDWENLPPTCIVCEYEDFKTVKLGYSTADVAEFLLEKGYRVFVSEWHPITAYGGKNHRWLGLYEWQSCTTPAKSWGNLIAFRVPISEADIAQAALTVRFSHRIPTALNATSKAKKKAVKVSPVALSTSEKLAHALRARHRGLFRASQIAYWGGRTVARHRILCSLAVLASILVIGAPLFLDLPWFIQLGGILIGIALLGMVAGIAALGIFQEALRRMLEGQRTEILAAARRDSKRLNGALEQTRVDIRKVNARVAVVRETVDKYHEYRLNHLEEIASAQAQGLAERGTVRVRGSR